MRAVRKHAGLTQTDIARKLETSQSAISKIEAGSLAPPLLIWMSFCKLMGIDAVETLETGFVDFMRPANAENVSVSLEENQGKIENFRIPARYLNDRGTSVRWLLPLLKFYSSRHGTDKLRKFLKSTMRIDPDFLVILDHSVNIQFVLDLSKHLVDSGDLTREDIATIAQFASNPDYQGFLHPILSRAVNAREKLTQLISNIERYETNFLYCIESNENNELRVSIKPREHLKRFDYLNAPLAKMCCDYRKGFLQAVSRQPNESAFKINEHQCLYDGADRCIYEIEIA
jgi:DNA-binding XRE family transcriptional regulator/predicted hydrocarbon binding protein